MIHEVDGDLYGDGVNIAARLQAMADPGSMCISGTAYDHLQGKLDCDYEYLGERALKNMERPVRLYRPVWDGPTARPTWRRPALPDRPSIAVLPFHAMSRFPYPANEKFPDTPEQRRIRELYLTRPALQLIRPLARR